ncbi:MAG: PQQ-binding-like beta-propeller repeat protein [marine benthic group bacterium]|nr:PQQ-binding-like beta-propeller repeat protein [Gemmatimonadota bacterium]
MSSLRSISAPCCLLLALLAGTALAQESLEPGDLIWSQEIGGQLWAPLEHHGGVLYFGSDDGTFHAFDIESRQVKWRFRTGGIIRSRAEVVGKHVIFSSDDGYLYSVNVDSGEELWRYDLGSAGFERVLPAVDPPYSYDYKHSSPLVRGRTVYIGSANGTLHAIHHDVGLAVWQFQADGPIRSTPATDGRNLFFGSWDGHLYALDLEDGSLSWSYDTGGIIQGSPATEAGRVFIGSRSASIFGLDAATGSERWKYAHADGSWVESSPVVDDAVLYIGSSDARALFALDAATGETVWTYETGGWSWGDPLIVDGVVYIGGLSAFPYYFEGVELRPGLHAVDQRSGDALWEFKPQKIDGYLTGGFYATPVIVDGVIYAGGIDGRLYALRQ